MPTLLKIDVSPRGDYSVSRQLGKTLEATWLAANPGGTVITRDLSKTPLPFVDLPWVAAAYSTPDQHTPEQAAAIKVSDDLIAELSPPTKSSSTAPSTTSPCPPRSKPGSTTSSASTRPSTPNTKASPAAAKSPPSSPAAATTAPARTSKRWTSSRPTLKLIFGFIGITDVTVHLAGDTTAVSLWARPPWKPT